MANVFRKTAMERLSSPDQLDRMIVITSPLSWLAIAGGFVIVVSALLWGIFGRLTESVEVSGIIISDAGAQQAVCYVPIETGKSIKPGMDVMIDPTTVTDQSCGHMEATVSSVESYITSREKIIQRLGDAELTDMFLQNGPVIEVVCSLKEDKGTASGYAWTGKKGADVSVADGTMFTANIVTESTAPISMLIP